MRQRLVSVGDDVWIETDSSERAHKVDGKALRLRQALVSEDAGALDGGGEPEPCSRALDLMAKTG
jgi:uncharacterized protein YxjI